MSILPGCEASYPQMLKMAQAQPLDRKIANSLALIRFYEQMALAVSPEGFYLAFSGGKDSIVLHELARMSGVRFSSWYNQTTIDPPEVVRFIRNEYPNCRWNRPPKNLIMSIADNTNGPPTRLHRWCCKIYKERGGTGLVKLIGVRAAESPRRADQWREIIVNRNGGHIVCPILYWTDVNVWEFIRARGLKYPSLYDEGWKRLGCIGCPMLEPKALHRDFARWPGFERLWKIGFQRFWNRWRGVPRNNGEPRALEKFPTLESFWAWWISREGWKSNEECQMKMNFSGEDEE